MHKNLCHAREVLAHPPLFAKKVLGFSSLYKWQEECLNECEWILANPDKRPNAISLLACNGSGKTSVFITSLVLWAMCAYKGALVVCTSGAFRQVSEQLFPNLKRFAPKFKNWVFNAVDLAALNYQNAYGNKYIQSQISALRQSDPQYWNNYDAQGAEILADLNKGGQLSDSQTRAVQQATRAQQAARGNAYGNASAAKEVYDQFIAGESLLAQRQQAANDFLKNSPFNNFNIGSITAYTPQISTSGYSTLAPYAYSNAMSTAQGNAQYQSNIYRLKNGWEMINYNQPAPFFAMLSGGMSGASSGAMTGFMTGGPIGAIVGGVIGGVSGGVMGAFGR